MPTKRQLEKERQELEAERDALPVVVLDAYGEIDEPKEAARAKKYTQISERLSELYHEINED